MIGAAAFLGLALAGCGSTTTNESSGDHRRCVEMGRSGSRGMRMVSVPCDGEAAQ
jgi:hypothetical protein